MERIIMNLIDSYVEAAVENLPQDEREYVRRKLRAEIEDQVGANPTEEKVRKVLERLGDPKQIGKEYNRTKRYLIGPKLYDSYITVLKLVLGIVAVVLTVVTFIEWIFNPPATLNLTQTPFRFTADMFISVWEGVLQAAVWVTVVFAIIERTKVNNKDMEAINKIWSSEAFKHKSKQGKGKISPVETGFALFFTTLFTVIIYFKPQIIAMYVKGANGSTEVTPLFDLQVLRFYMLPILILFMFQLGILMWKFISLRWTIPLAIVQTIYNIALCALMVAMLTDKALFNPDFLTKVSEYTKASLTLVSEGWDKLLWSFEIIFIFGCVIDSVSAFFKCRNNRDGSSKLDI
jgi:hypothetical protein